MLLNCHSYFSLKYGVLSPKELVETIEEFGHEVAVLTDVNNTSGVFSFVQEAIKKNIKPVVGIDFRSGIKQHYVGIAKNQYGFCELNKLLTAHLHEDQEEAPHFTHCYVIYPLDNIPQRPLKEYEYIGVYPDEVNNLVLPKWDDLRKKMVILATATFTRKVDFNLHRLLRSIDLNTLLDKLDEEDQAEETDVFHSKEGLEMLYKSFPHIIENTRNLLKNCEFEFEFGTNKNPQTYTGTEEGDHNLLVKLCKEGIAYRYDELTPEIEARIKKEMDTVREMGFVSYFLINWDIINYARSRGFYYVGRGSGANSVLAYLLRITDVDPIELDLYFERFINLFRKTPPDFDIDFSWTDRDEIYDYIFERFPNVALLANYQTFQGKSSVRQLGKVFGLPSEEIESIQRVETMKQYEHMDTLHKIIFQYSLLLRKMPSHLGIHASGVLISEKPIHYYSATFMPPKGYPTVQYDMVVAEDIGLSKFDILSQRGLGKIKDALTIIRKNHPEKDPIDIHDVKMFVEDEKVKSMLRNGEAIGCFYVESPAMRMLLKKLKDDSYLGLVAASSIIRPGVAKSGMMREYILRLRNPERRKEAHPVLMSIMPETFGIMVYQEDVIKVAHHFAGLTLGEADVLRRGMAGKYRSKEEFQEVKELFFKNCAEKGYGDEITKQVWDQTESFAGYAFAKGHSASYAIESYQCLYLKAHYPLEYMVSVINNHGGFYRNEFYIHEARMMGGEIHGPCIFKSNKFTSIEGKDIYLGLNQISEISYETIDLILGQRKETPFLDFYDFLDRTEISLEQTKSLILAGALRNYTANRKKLLWKTHFYFHNTPVLAQRSSLFEVEHKTIAVPTMEDAELEVALDHIKSLGFPLCSPYSLIEESKMNSYPLVSRELQENLGKKVSILGYLVTVKRTQTNKKDRMNFGTFIDMEGNFIDTVHFPPSAKKSPFRGMGVYLLEGKVVEEYDFLTIEVNQMEKMPYRAVEELENR